MTKNNTLTGHLSALMTILIWGTTFISTKVLLKSFSPIEILFIRFLIGYAALWIVSRKKLTPRSRSHEVYFLLAGLCGVSLYYLLENIALTYTLASNVGVIISIAPFFTALFECLFLKGKRPGFRFFAGFILAITGICLISFGSGDTISINPLGDLLAAAAAVVWAAYSTLTKKISSFGYPTIHTTRRTFFYGLVFMIPTLISMGFHVTLSQFTDTTNLLNLLFLGLGASALCFVTWNLAVRILGSVKTSVYIYMVPVITTVTSALILHEHITTVALCGMGLTLAGLFLSESKQKKALSANECID